MWALGKMTKLNTGPRTRQALGAVRSRGLKKRITRAEQALKDALEQSGIWFKFQPHFFTEHRLYIPDFRLATHTHKLLIEVDGPSHLKQKHYDDERTNWLMAKRNCLVLRFTNDEVLNGIDRVMASILSKCPKRVG